MYKTYRYNKAPKAQLPDLSLRRKVILYSLFAAMLVLILRGIYLQVVTKNFLRHKGTQQQVDVISVSAYRGKILDRNGEPLAISSPVQSVWADPEELHKTKPEADSEQARQLQQLQQLEVLLGLSPGKITKLQAEDSKRHFVYLARKIHPQLAAKVKAMNVPGIYLQREFKRYYPAGASSAHIVGFTDLEERGQEGIELGFEEVLKEHPGKRRVIRDGKGQIIEAAELTQPINGQDLQLSIDQRIQYLAFRELQTALVDNKAKAATLVVLNAKTGEVLAAVNQPGFNPNVRKHPKGITLKNMAFTDVFEPGSTSKPFTVAAALEGNFIDPNVEIETHGSYPIGRNVVTDTHNYGTLTLTGVLKKSSNVGASKIALQMPPDYFWNAYHNLGFGTPPQSGYPGEARGSLTDYRSWKPFDQAIVSYGYGLNASILQLARAYTALADDGWLHSVSLLKREHDPHAVRLFSAQTAQQVRTMLETVLEEGGTALQARVDGYRIAGKTGTVKKLGANGKYTDNKYLGLFVGMAPASNPRLVIAIMVDEPGTGKYYGGQVAAPAFAKIMAGALRILGIPPDEPENMPILLVKSPLK